MRVGRFSGSGEPLKIHRGFAVQLRISAPGDRFSKIDVDRTAGEAGRTPNTGPSLPVPETVNITAVSAPTCVSHSEYSRMS